ncbi:MAG: ATP-binding protein [Acetobacter sp.]|nr:ATP-binding protein [Bacteroides sp.]MCM1341188.1 ATP-binding protein [Acetobacter sp.]MCM1433831.1 ATP-binding protein [Clostridiales bacterium]
MMNKATKIKYYIDSLCIYDIKQDSVIKAMCDLIDSAQSEQVLVNQSSFFNLLSAASGLKNHISRCILTHDNEFTKACAGGRVSKLSPRIIDAVKSDLKKLEEISSLTAQDIAEAVENNDIKEILATIPEWEIGCSEYPLEESWENCLDRLAEYYKQNGYGMYARNIAFTWRDKQIIPVNSIDTITLTDLKNYEFQREKVIDNTESFVTGHPANNVLLYGDRGTGKSSTVHALLNEYYKQGLRMIEIPKSAVADLTLIREQIADSPMKFIIYIDDLSFDSNDNSFSELKAALEGSLSGRQSNILIYATSNRRHLIKESFSDRENDVNRNDIMQEQLSLSDRFGLTITFLNPNKQEYLDIVMKIAQDRGLTDVDKEHLCFMADQWATRRGGRSPRCAKQFVDYVESCHKRKVKW